MTKTFLSLILGLSLLAFACKQPSSSGQNDPAPATSEASNQIATDQQKTEQGIAFTKADAPISQGYIDLFVNGVWHYGGILDMKAEVNMQKGEGRWLKFNADKTFSFGQWGDEKRTGRWHFVEDDAIMEMIYDDDKSRLLGYECQFGGEDAVVMVGKGKYRTNSTQFKLEKFEGYPQK